MFDQSIEPNQEVEKVFEDYGIHFRRFEGVTEQGNEKFSSNVFDINTRYLAEHEDESNNA